MNNVELFVPWWLKNGGYQFTCQKKSTGFLRWLEGMEGRVLLITDWREAKPIMEGLSNLGQIQRIDILMCVVARSDRMFRRAIDWAGKQSSDTDIMVRRCESRDVLRISTGPPGSLQSPQTR